MEVTNQVSLNFAGVNFPKIVLNSTKPFDQAGGGSIDLDIKPYVYYPDDSHNTFNIVQRVRLVAEGYFDLELVAIGMFQMISDADVDQKKAFVNSNAPAIMFPYVRSFIATLTTNLGDVTGALVIPPQFFKGELPEMEADDKI